MSLFDAVLAGDREAVKSKLAAGADPNPFDSEGRTPLMAAARKGRADIVRLLLEAGADPELTDSLGETALIMAAAHGNADVCRLLLPHAKDDERDLARTLLSGVGITDLRPEPNVPPPDDFRRKLASAGAYVAGKLGDDGPTKRLERALRSEKPPKR
ncbi:ankyrin repeat domain-containing protein [Pyxidicoccus fallax]|uniref:Ankyrin repeat domain-containing protein n=1 Tax=Pyxidicoccus fallax TaxID=394095 RepID=A0A848LAN5_9BACT|nr:ankyrin repeat domain-containing protein [Pyxidicoccus fallax]NMO16120.1 ankyrin repeat domain-containing protein [Pyxidicoccus fallax]NPC80070.1 ankyrin repeat domain-containing protein [Pyxidicoccus fallax]